MKDDVCIKTVHTKRWRVIPSPHRESNRERPSRVRGGELEKESEASPDELELATRNPIRPMPDGLGSWNASGGARSGTKTPHAPATVRLSGAI